MKDNKPRMRDVVQGVVRYEVLERQVSKSSRPDPIALTVPEARPITRDVPGIAEAIQVARIVTNENRVNRQTEIQRFADLQKRVQRQTKEHFHQSSSDQDESLVPTKIELVDHVIANHRARIQYDPQLFRLPDARQKLLVGMIHESALSDGNDTSLLESKAKISAMLFERGDGEHRARIEKELMDWTTGEEKKDDGPNVDPVTQVTLKYVQTAFDAADVNSLGELPLSLFLKILLEIGVEYAARDKEMIMDRLDPTASGYVTLNNMQKSWALLQETFTLQSLQTVTPHSISVAFDRLPREADTLNLSQEHFQHFLSSLEITLRNEEEEKVLYRSMQPITLERVVDYYIPNLNECLKHSRSKH